MNNRVRRALLPIVVILLLLPSIAITVFAATCTVDGCELTYTTSTFNDTLVDTNYLSQIVQSTRGGSHTAEWNEGERRFVLSTSNSTYYTSTTGNWIKTTWYNQAQNYGITLTLTNNTDNALKIQYTVSGTVDGYAAGEYSVTLNSQKSISFSLVSKATEATTPTSTTYTGYIHIDSVTALENVDVSFASSSRGDYSYQISGAEEVSVSKDAEASETQSLTYGTQVTLTKGTVDDGYAFYGWMASGKLLGTTDGTYAIEDDAVIYPVYLEDDVLSGAARYKVGSNAYWLWGPAFADAKSSGNTVIVNESHALPTTLEDAGLNAACTSSDYVSISNGNATYTVPYGCKLLLPYGSSDTGSFTSEPTNYISESESCTMYDEGDMAGRNFVYRFLSVPASVKINCYGQINVNGQRQNDGQPYSGVTLGGYGKIELNGAANEEQLVINSGATLYCYGYITGTGMVNVASGGTIHELMQVCDWPGGTNASNWNDAATANASLFALSQYYVQNVESDLKFNSGATAYIEAVLTATGSSQTVSAAYVGTNSGLFLLQDGYVIRLYDESSDRMTYSLYGTLDIGYLEIKKTFLGQDIINLNSSNYVLPLGNNMTIQIESGSTLNMSQQIALVPGSEVIVANGASMNLSGQIYIVDVKDWSRTYFFNRASMTDPSGDTSITVTANTSADFAPVPYVATLNAISPRTTELVRGCTVDKDDGSIAQRYYMKAVNCSASGKLVVNGTLNVTGAICTTNANNSADKVVTGIGMIDYDAAPNAGTLKGGYSSTIRDISTTYGLANIAGVGTLKAFAKSTYYGQSDNYWYSHIINTNIPGAITVTSGSGTNGTTLSPMDGRNVENIVGLVANGGTLTFTLNGDYVVSVGDEELPPAADGTYTIGEITADTTITLTHRAVHLDAINASADAEIILMLYFTDPCGLLDDTAKVTVTMTTAKTTTTNDVTTTEDVPESTSYTLSDLKVGDRYLVSQPVASGEMTSPVTVTFTDAQGNVIPVYDYIEGTCSDSVTKTVTDYAERVLAVSEKENQIAIIKALVTYGGYSQLYFGTNTSDPAYSILDEIPTVSDVAISNEDYSINRSGDSIGITQTTQQAYLNSAIYLRVYFEGDTTGLNFTLTSPKGGSTVTTSVTPVQDGSRYYVDIKDIPAAYLDNTYTITVTGNGGTYTVNTSVFAYLKDLLDNSKDEKQINAAKAMYLYGTAASEFFDR